ncbi:MAG TPA: alpha/beta hydrolase [Ktedonobacteraceae bacterium]|nr:alpha/beta hydrolase [Ktedonobacteraceae bacterium]
MNRSSIFKLLGAIGLGVPLVGLLYQQVAQVLDRRRFVPPGQLIDVGGYRLHLYCMGEATGRPSVVLEGGLPSTYLDWSKVQSEIAQFTQVCSYDRAGFGYSDTGPHGYTAQDLVEQLHTLLVKSDTPAPYVLVGHSFGGLLVRLYATCYPQEVVGLVLLDSTHEDLYRVQPDLARLAEKERRQMELFSWLTPFGMMRLLLSAGLTPVGQLAYPPEVLPRLKSFFSQTRFLHITARAYASMEESMAQVRASRDGFSFPVTILSQRAETDFGDQEAADNWHELQRDLCTLSPQSQQIIAEKSGHYIQLDQPELVINAIKSLVFAER